MSQPTNHPGRNAPIFDSAVPPADRDQTHALVIGIGTYPYLHDGSGYRRDSRVPTWGMKQLKSPVVSARAFADWLCLGYQNSSAPLGSVNLLLSPANPFAATGRTPLPVDPPEMETVQAAYDAWYARCDARPGNIALFYFCGHGVADGFNSLLLCADYGADEARPFAGLIDLQGTFVGTATCRAKTLCFFIDACRTSQDVNAKGVALRTYLPEPFGDRDYRLTRSAAYDQSAYGQSNMVSVFTDVLLDCLRDGLGVNRRREDDACWVITTESLQENLARLLAARSDRRKALPCDTYCPLSPIGRPSCTSPIRSGSCRRSRVYPKEAGSLATLTLTRPGEAPVNRPAAGVWEFDMPAGPCDVSARFLRLYQDIHMPGQVVSPRRWVLSLPAKRIDTATPGTTTVPSAPAPQARGGGGA